MWNCKREKFEICFIIQGRGQNAKNGPNAQVLTSRKPCSTQDPRINTESMQSSVNQTADVYMAIESRKSHFSAKIDAPFWNDAVKPYSWLYELFQCITL